LALQARARAPSNRRRSPLKVTCRGAARVTVRVRSPDGEVVVLVRTSLPVPGRSTDRTRVVAPDGRVVVLVRTSPPPPGRSTDRTRVVAPEGRSTLLVVTSAPRGRSTERVLTVAPDGRVVWRVVTEAPPRVVVVCARVVVRPSRSCAENSVVAASFAEANVSGAVIAAQANAPAASMLDIRIMSVLFFRPGGCRAKTRFSYPPPSASAQ
jgi:hypothetical protein